MWNRFKQRFLKKSNRDIDGIRKYKGKKKSNDDDLIPRNSSSSYSKDDSPIPRNSTSSTDSVDKCKLIQLSVINKHHLIVDDSQTNRYVLAKYLQRCGITIDEASDGLECLAMVEKNPLAYDAIWMDLRMPKMDGMETTYKLRSVMGFSNYIIGLTGHVEVESRKRCIKLGMNYVIPKPIIRNELYGLLFELFQIESPDSN